MIRLWLLLMVCIVLGPGEAWSQATGTRPHRGFGHLNKLAVRNYLPCGGTNVVTGWVNHTDPRCQQLSLNWLSDWPNVLTNTSVHIVRDKQIVKRVEPIPIIGNAITPDCDTTDVGVVAPLAANLTVNAPVCTGDNPEDEQELELRLFSPVPRLLTFNVAYSEENGITFPASTTGDGVTWNRLKVRFNAVSNKWGLVAKTQGIAAAGAGYIHLPAAGAKLPLTGTPATISMSGNFPRILFDDTTSQCIEWAFKAPGDYAGTPRVTFDYYMLSDDTGSLSMDWYVMAHTPGDAVVITTDSYGSVNGCVDANVPSTIGYTKSLTCPLTNDDGLAANDSVKLRACLNTAGTASGSAAYIVGYFSYAR